MVLVCHPRGFASEARKAEGCGRPWVPCWPTWVPHGTFGIPGIRFRGACEQMPTVDLQGAYVCFRVEQWEKG